MTILRLLTEQVTVLQAPQALDGYGTPAPDWPNATRVIWPGRLEPRVSREDTQDRDAQQADAVVYLPPEATVTGHDRIEAQGRTWEVVGPPKVATTPWRASHLEVAVRWVSG